MEIIGTLCTLLEEKKGLFLQYETATQELLHCDEDSCVQYITVRDQLANEIDEKTEEIARLCEESSDSELLMNAAFARADFEGMPGEYHCVFYGGQAVRSVISRILETDKQAAAHLQRLRNDALEGVKLNKEIPKIKKYLTDLSEQPHQGTLHSDKA